MTVDDARRYDVLLLLGDLNARVGCYNKNRERVIGKHGVGDLTSNGERVINLLSLSFSRTGISTNSHGYDLPDESRARLIMLSSIANVEAHFKMCG